MWCLKWQNINSVILLCLLLVEIDLFCTMSHPLKLCHNRCSKIRISVFCESCVRLPFFYVTYWLLEWVICVVMRPLELFQELKYEIMCCLHLCDIKQSWTQSVFCFYPLGSSSRWQILMEHAAWRMGRAGETAESGVRTEWQDLMMSASSKTLSLTVLQHWEQAWSHHPQWTQRICSEVFWTTRK